MRYQALIITMIVAAGACGRPAARAPRADTLRDDYGVPIAIGRRPQRIVSLNPATTQTLFAIGAGARIVGRSKYDLFPPEAARIPDLGDALRPNVEAVLAARPDLVLLYASADDRTAADRLRQAGIPTVSFKNDSIGQFARDTRILGRVIGDSAAADRVVDTVMATLDRVRRATAGLPRPTVLLHAWDKPVMVLGGGSFMSELLEIAGARNAYADKNLPSLTVTLEDIVRRNPDYILAGADEAVRLRANPEWRAVPAVREGRILVYDMDLVARPSVQLGAAAVSLANLIHPGAVK